jgi:hypothetical protein
VILAAELDRARLGRGTSGKDTSLLVPVMRPKTRASAPE